MRSIAKAAIATSVVSALSLVHLSHAGASGVEFQPAPISIGNECSTMVLKGTARFSNTAYIVPNVIVSINKSGEQLFEVVKTGQDDYLLRMALYLPSDLGEALEYRGNNSNQYAHPCNLDQIQRQLSQSSPDAMAANALSSFQISPLPIKKIQTWVQGLDNAVEANIEKPGLKGVSGIDHVFEFKIHGAQQYGEFLARVSSSTGIEVKVHLIYDALSSQSFYNVQIDSDKLLEKLRTHLSGDIQVVTHAQLAADISKSLDEMKVSVYQEGNVDDSYRQMAQDMISQFGKDLMEPLTPSTPDAPENGTDKTQYKVQATLDYIKTQKKFTLNYQKMSDAEEHIYETSTRVSATVKEIEDRARLVSSDEGWTQLFPGYVKANTQVTIGVTERVSHPLSFTKATYRYSKSAIEGNGELASVFPVVTEAQSHLDKVTNAGTYQIRTPHWYGYILPVSKDNPTSQDYYWEYSVATPHYVKRYSNDITLALTQPKSGDASEKLGTVETLPLIFSFSNMGDKTFTLDELRRGSSFFKADFDEETARIVINSTKDLGLVYVKNVEHIPNYERVTKKYTQYWSDMAGCLFGKCNSVTSVEGDIESFKMFQSVYTVSMQHPKYKISQLDQLQMNKTKQDGVMVGPNGVH